MSSVRTAVVLSLLFSFAPLPAASEFRFSLNGEPDEPSTLPVLGERKGELASWGLAHPREINRRKTVLALDSRDGEPLLLKFLENPQKPRDLPEELTIDPGGGVTATPEPPDLPDDSSPRHVAAWVLASRSCQAARPILENLAATGPADERRHYATALERLDQKRP